MGLFDNSVGMIESGLARHLREDGANRCERPTRMGAFTRPSRGKGEEKNQGNG